MIKTQNEANARGVAKINMNNNDNGTSSKLIYLSLGSLLLSIHIILSVVVFLCCCISQLIFPDLQHYQDSNKELKLFL